MPREATLFEQSVGSPVRAYLMMKNDGSANIPPNWIERSRTSRKNREAKIAKLLKKGHIHDIIALEDWEQAFKKECFYHGIRALLELERDGKTKL